MIQYITKLHTASNRNEESTRKKGRKLLIGTFEEGFKTATGALAFGAAGLTITGMRGWRANHQENIARAARKKIERYTILYCSTRSIPFQVLERAHAQAVQAIEACEPKQTLILPPSVTKWINFVFRVEEAPIEEFKRDLLPLPVNVNFSLENTVFEIREKPTFLSETADTCIYSKEKSWINFKSFIKKSKITTKKKGAAFINWISPDSFRVKLLDEKLSVQWGDMDDSTGFEDVIRTSFSRNEKGGLSDLPGGNLLAERLDTPNKFPLFNGENTLNQLGGLAAGEAEVADIEERLAELRAYNPPGELLEQPNPGQPLSLRGGFRKKENNFLVAKSMAYTVCRYIPFVGSIIIFLVISHKVGDFIINIFVPDFHDRVENYFEKNMDPILLKPTGKRLTLFVGSTCFSFESRLVSLKKKINHTKSTIKNESYIKSAILKSSHDHF